MTDLQTMLADFSELSLDWTAQHLFDHSESFELAAAAVDETWWSGWAPRTDPGDSATDPRRCSPRRTVWTWTTFTRSGESLWAQVRAGSSVLFGPTALTDTGMSDEVIAAFTDQCTICSRGPARRSRQSAPNGPTAW